jgi:glucokinase
MIVLAGDVGGTRTRLGIFSIENRNFTRLAFERYETKKFDSLVQIVKAFLDTADAHPRAAAFGLAGPVIDGVCDITNVGWKVDVAELSKAINIPRTTIVNDFVANAHGLVALRPKDLAAIQRGKHEGLANQVLIGPGTGLGEAIITRHGGDIVVVPSEGAHQDFAPQDGVQIELLRYLQKKFQKVSKGHVSYERVVSGPGIVNIYEFLKSARRAKESPIVQKALRAKGADKPALIMRLARKDKLCKMAANLFFSVLGAEAGNIALQATAFGGVYLTASTVRNNIALLKQSQFLKYFRNKGRQTVLMKQIPVYVVKNEQLGILGAAALASELF